MTSRPAIPLLVLIPGESKDDYRSIYAIAMAYAKSGLLISEEAQAMDQPEFVFPAVVCSSFAIELFLKAFIALENTEAEPASRRGITGHPLVKLWNKISPERQAVIAGMFRNPTGVPSLSAIGTRIMGFVDALDNLGLQPFVKWRYVHEFEDVTHMSHAALVEITDALSRAAIYVMQGSPDAIEAESSVSSASPTRAELPLIRGSDALLLGRDSLLRQIPSNCAPEQIRCLDGIRHALEIMDVTFSRLRGALTNVALHPPESTALPDVIAHVFLDAWGFVHAVKHFERMYSRLTRKSSEAKASIPALREVTQEFRNVLKVASEGFGELSWLTGVQIQPEAIVLHCTLLPGTLSAPPAIRTDPIQSTLDWPTDCIKLSAGGYEANLSLVRKHVALRMRHLEAQLHEAFQAPNAQGQVINDAFMTRPVKVKGLADV
jgi:hypothetical protein